MSLRLFVALRPPPEVRDVLLSLMSGIEGARWQSDRQLHLTLAFVGEVSPRAAEDIHLSLSRIAAPAFTARLGGFGSFSGRAGRVGALWIGVEASAPLVSLQQSVARALALSGHPPEARRFVPHVTLARFAGAGVTPPTLRRFLEAAPAPSAEFRVETFHLVESRLGGTGAHYDSLAAFSLKGSSAGPHRW
jgi:2'-5' RNA ligase